jgi:hypothetical protein
VGGGYRGYKGFIMPIRSNAQDGDLNVNQSGMVVNGNQIIGRDIHFVTLEQYAPAGLYAFYKLRDIIEKMTAGTDRLSKDIDGCTKDIMQLMQLRDQYPREFLRQQRTLVLDRAADILQAYSQDLDTMSKQYAANLQEIERSVGSFIMAHQVEARLNRDEILQFAAMLHHFENRANVVGTVLNEMLSSMQTIATGVTTERLNEAASTGKSRVYTLIELFKETAMVTTRLVTLLNTFI